MPLIGLPYDAGVERPRGAAEIAVTMHRASEGFEAIYCQQLEAAVAWLAPQFGASRRRRATPSTDPVDNASRGASSPFLSPRWPAAR